MPAAFNVSGKRYLSPLGHYSIFLGTDPGRKPIGPDDEDDDDEIEMGGVTQTLKCPLTLLPFVDAHTRQVSQIHRTDLPKTLIPFDSPSSMPCRHSYSGAAIKEHILSAVPATNRKKQVPEVDREAKCPVAGCSHKLKLGDVRVSG